MWHSGTVTNGYKHQKKWPTWWQVKFDGSYSADSTTGSGVGRAPRKAASSGGNGAAGGVISGKSDKGSLRIVDLRPGTGTWRLKQGWQQRRQQEAKVAEKEQDRQKQVAAGNDMVKLYHTAEIVGSLATEEGARSRSGVIIL